MTATSLVTRRSDLLSARVGDELVMLDPGANAYLTLNDIATIIWDLLERPTRVQDVCNMLTSRFEVVHQTCLSDVLVHLDDLRRRSLITVDAE